MIEMLSPETLRVIFVVGFVLQVLLGAWAIVTVTRMRREQTIAFAILNSLAARAGLQRAADKLESGLLPAGEREAAAPPAPEPPPAGVDRRAST